MLITEELASFLSAHKLSLWYAGYIDDSITEELIDLADFDVDAGGLGKSKNKVSFLMAESFQNIVRHKLDYSDGGDPHGTFGISSKNQAVNIFSANVVKDEFVEEIKDKLEGVNQLSQEELRSHYRETLGKGKFSDKGGAGLGLIEMARKSGRPLQYDFSPTNEGHIFSMQVDHQLNKSNESYVPTPIDESLEIKNELNKGEIILLFKGDMKPESIAPVLRMLSNNTKGEKNEQFRHHMIFEIGHVLLQNISAHGVNKHEAIEGIFAVGREGEKLKLTTINKVESLNIDSIKSYIDRINASNQHELMHWLETLSKEDDEAEAGLVNVGILSPDPMSYEFEETAQGSFFKISVLV